MKRWSPLGLACAGVAAAAVFLAGSAWALDGDVKCESKKNKEAGKYTYCRMKAEAIAVKKGIDPDYSKCDTKFSDKWGKTENSAGAGVCPSEGDEDMIQELSTAFVDCVADILSGATETCELCPEGGAFVGGYCWYLGAPNQSCTAACASAGLALVCHEASTRDYAGSGGSLENCYAVLEALGQTSPPLGDMGDSGPCVAGYGCRVDGGTALGRCTSPATDCASASSAGSLRACACRPITIIPLNP